MSANMDRTLIMDNKRLILIIGLWIVLIHNVHGQANVAPVARDYPITALPFTKV